jgi:predicted membrane channel-forming protein YqfA (hemolysin III family)
MNVETTLIAVLFAEQMKKAVRVIRLLITLVLGVATLWVIYKASIYLYRAVNWKDLINAHVGVAALLLSVVVLATGVALFGWKLLAPVSYGFGEVSFGILSGFTLLLHIGKDYDPTRFMGTVGSIYIVSRGFSNIKEGLEKAGLFNNLWPFK